LKYPPPIQLKACIHLGACFSYCKRELPADEFRFTDAEYAATIYDERVNAKTPIVACAECIDALRAKQTRQ
jgi:ferredoxin